MMNAFAWACVQAAATEAIVRAKDVVLAIAQLDAYSSLKVPLGLIDVVLGEDFLDRRGIVERTALRSRQFNSMAKAIAAGAEVSECLWMGGMGVDGCGILWIHCGISVDGRGWFTDLMLTSARSIQMRSCGVLCAK